VGRLSNDGAMDELPRLPARDPRGHKGTFGTVVVIGGCCRGERRMIGAPALAALGALRAGAGLAKLVMPERILDAAIGICPSATGVPVPISPDGGMEPHEVARIIDEQIEGAACLVVGPGLGDGDGARAAALRCVQQDQVPVVVDADAINMLAEIPELWRDFRAGAILTPHPGEYRTLSAALGIQDDPVDPAKRPGAAEDLARRLGCIVVLKGAGTVVSDGQRAWVNPSGGPVLATAGTGDVLSGIIAGLVAQFVAFGLPAKMPRPKGKPLDLFDAARVGVHAHGLAAEEWVRRHGAGSGLIAGELGELVPGVMGRLREEQSA
jgi:ADP-dependent NAD(P)H-hydrate dehydratase